MHWGACAEHIEEILDDKSLNLRKPASLHFSIHYKEAEIQGIDFSCWVQEHDSAWKVSRKEDNIPSSPKNLIVRRTNNEYLGVRIDQVEELVFVPIGHIHALPYLMRRTRRIHTLWGIAVVKHRMRLLIDLTQFARHHPGEHSRVS